MNFSRFNPFRPLPISDQARRRVLTDWIGTVLFWSVLAFLFALLVNFTSKDEHKLEELPIPHTGALVRYDEPLSIVNYGQVRISNSGSDTHAYIRINLWQNDKPHMTLFVRAGDSVRLHLPFDRYKIRYATGTHWFGEWNEALFGMGTDRFEFKSPLVLRTKDSKTIQTIDLNQAYKQQISQEVSTFK